MTSTGATSSASQSIITALGSGSGIDLAALTTSLVDAQFAAKTAQLKTKGETLTAQISGVSTLKSGINNFATALTSLVKGGTLQTQPTSSSAAIGVSATPGAKLSGLSASVSVNRLATAQAATTGTLGKRTDALGTGTIRITLGQATVDANGAMTGFAASSATPIDIVIGDDAAASVDAVAARINAAKAGVTASVVTDAQGNARLSLKGPTGTDNGFTMDVTEGATAGLSRIAVGPNQTATRITGTATNAELTVDGITVERGSNTVADLVDGVTMTLSAVSAAPVTIGTSRPTAALTQSVNDVVDAFNELLVSVKEQTNALTGALRGDPGAQTLLRQMRSLTLTPLIPAGTGGPRTLAEIGVGTERDGSLKVDAAQLSAAMARFPDRVEAMFAVGTGATNAGLSATINTIAFNASGTTYGLGASTKRYTQSQSDLAEQQTKLEDQSAKVKDRLTKQFASMDARVAAYKSTQSFMENQIKAWNSDN